MKKQVSYLLKNDKEDKQIIFLVIRSKVGAICGNETSFSNIPPTDNLANKIFWTEENFSIFLNFFSSYRVIPIEETEGMSYNEIKLYTQNEIKEIFDFSKLTYNIGVEKDSRSKFVIFNTLKTSTEIDLKSKYIMLEVIIKMQVDSKKYRIEFDTNFQDIKYFNLEYSNGSFKMISDEELFDNNYPAKSIQH